jgi:two-component system sensor histidine kinase TctE
MNSPSIRKRLLAWLLVPTVLILAVGTLSDYFTALPPYRDAFDQVLFDAAIAVSGHIRTDAQGHRTLSLPPDAIAILRYDSYDSIFFKITTDSGDYIAGDRDLPQLPEESSNPARAYAQYHGESVRLVTYRAQSANGVLNVSVAETLHKHDQTRRRILGTALAVDICQFSLVLVLIWIGVRLALGPLRTVEAQIASRSARDLTPLPRESVPTEIEGLVTALNRLFVTVRATGDAQRRFLESAAHQLRTPLTGLQVQLELLTEDPAAAPVRERLAPLLDATQRLTHTTQQLLALARSEEAANLRWEFTQIELPEVVETTVADRISAALGAGIDMGADTEPGTIQGVRWLLLEALSNLVNNAIAHTPPGGTITVRCGVAAGGEFLEVSDSGVGIPVDEREQVLGRFYRGTNARGAGSGLGLAIVAEVAQLHGASTSIDAGPDGKGTTVRISFQRPGPQLNR